MSHPAPLAAALVAMLMWLTLGCAAPRAEPRGVKLVASPSLGSGHRLALVIGNGKYPEGRLENPVNDARDIAKTLEKVGFEVMLETNVGLEAMDRLDAMCNDPEYHVSMLMQPGDMQFVNNYHVLHARQPYEDDRPNGVVRHLKRLWLETDLIDDDDKPERFRLHRGSTSSYWSSRGRTKSEVTI